jgi:Collagen triple helix repeat (20 copies)
MVSGRSMGIVTMVFCVAVGCGGEGPMGPAGPAGAVGPAGPAGTQGLMGVPGGTGPAGPAGPQGESGSAAAKGDPGAPGAMGAQGVPGPAGEQGPMGAPGPAGPAGPPGAVGQTGPMGQPGAMGLQGIPGAGITSNKQLVGPMGNLCPFYAERSVQYTGGQRVLFSDGSVFLSASTLGIKVSSSGDTDTNESSLQVFFSSSMETSWQILTEICARGTGTFRRLFLAWTRQPEMLGIYFDTNGNSTCCTGDELVGPVTFGADL